MTRIAIEKEEGGPLVFRATLVRRARGRVGSKEYQHLFIHRLADEVEDVICEGEYACAYETTAALHNLGLLEATHTTVDGFEKEVIESSEWVRVDKPIAGAIGILERKKHLDGSLGTRHTFTCVGDDMTVHNDANPEIRTPQLCAIADFMHHTGAKRKVEAYYIHKKVLDEK